MLDPVNARRPAKHLVQHGAKRKDVGAHVSGLAFGLFRRHVGNRAEDGSLIGPHGFVFMNLCSRDIVGTLRRGLGQLSQTKIEDLYLLSPNNNVRRFQIAMHNACGVRARQAVGNLNGNAQCFPELHAVPRNQLIERAAGDKLHGDEVHPIGLIDFIDGDDTRMAQ